MSEASRVEFSLRRFLIRVVPLAIVAGVAWKFTSAWNADFTVWLVKAIHRLFLHPAPYLFCDTRRYFWHATMFPPVLALTLASYWLPWWDRGLRAMGGYVAYCGLTAIAIAINESPYLQQTDVLVPMSSTLVNANYLMFSVVIWVLAAGPWYGGGRLPRAERIVEASPKKRWYPAWLGGWGTRVLILWAAVAMVVPAYAMFGTPEAMAARAKVARRMRLVPFFPNPSGADVDVSAAEQLTRDDAVKKVLDALRETIEADAAAKRDSAALWHLTGRLLDSMRPPNAETARQIKLGAARALIKARKLRK